MLTDDYLNRKTTCLPEIKEKERMRKARITTFNQFFFDNVTCLVYENFEILHIKQ